MPNLAMTSMPNLAMKLHFQHSGNELYRQGFGDEQNDNNFELIFNVFFCYLFGFLSLPGCGNGFIATGLAMSGSLPLYRP